MIFIAPNVSTLEGDHDVTGSLSAKEVTSPLATIQALLAATASIGSISVSSGDSEICLFKILGFICDSATSKNLSKSFSVIKKSECLGNSFLKCIFSIFPIIGAVKPNESSFFTKRPNFSPLQLAEIPKMMT